MRVGWSPVPGLRTPQPDGCMHRHTHIHSHVHTHPRVHTSGPAQGRALLPLLGDPHPPAQHRPATQRPRGTRAGAELPPTEVPAPPLPQARAHEPSVLALSTQLWPVCSAHMRVAGPVGGSSGPLPSRPRLPTPFTLPSPHPTSSTPSRCWNKPLPAASTALGNLGASTVLGNHTIYCRPQARPTVCQEPGLCFSFSPSRVGLSASHSGWKPPVSNLPGASLRRRPRTRRAGLVSSSKC